LNKLFFKKIVLIACLLAIFWLGFFSFQSSPQTIPVLNYHMVEDYTDSHLAVGTEEFETQMAYLAKRGYTSITPDQLVEYLEKGTSLPEKPVLITFDDGYQDNFTNAYPIMKKYGFTGTIFLITDYIGQDAWYMSWEQVREMSKNGFVFGSHTLSHTPLTTITLVDAEKQLRESREVLEWRLAVPVTYFAYPTGAYSRSIEAMTKNAGYNAAFTVDFGKVAKKDDLYALKRIPIFKSKASLVNFYLRVEMTPVANALRSIKEKIWPTTSEEQDI
jgi:peptidoglycan/xylan/chitin deacetylase (PgdA/CDA1 family)